MNTGNCPVCGQTFTSEHYQPRRRYCSERCRKAAWRRRHPGRRRRRDTVPPPGVARRDTVPPPGVARPDTVSRPDGVVDAVAAREPAARCPHCAHPVAVITLLVAPAAAQVPIPAAPHD